MGIPSMLIALCIVLFIITLVFGITAFSKYKQSEDKEVYPLTRQINLWSILVLANSVVCFLFALDNHNSLNQLLGILAGIFSFIYVYVFIDQMLFKHKQFKLRTCLWISTLIKACSQFAPITHIVAGAAAIEASKYLIPDKGFLQAYLTTIITGFLLSLVVAALMAVSRFVMHVMKNISESNQKYIQ